MAQAALVGGLFIGILSALPVIKYANCCCIWIIGGGIVAAYLDQQNDQRPITPGRGALAGLFAGVFGAVVWLVAALAVRALLAPLEERMASAFLRNAPDIPPDVRTILENAGTSSVVEYVVFFVLFLFAGSIVSTVGGLLGAAFFRNDVPPALGGPPPLPPE
ncbi:MAG TPA: DUF5518 domain-containing protein [Vicinamibacterales bacterium]|nr:DUF5518 domain-containing protein [Vicinamibacterales bacterium]